MASLAQYSATLLEEEQRTVRPAPGAGTRVMGAAIYAAVFVLVGVAGLLQSGA